jgi:hypothetical protein
MPQSSRHGSNRHENASVAMMNRVVIEHIRTSIRSIPLLLSLVAAVTGSARPDVAADNASTPPVIVIGFVGGFVKYDDTVHSTVQLAARLRQNHPAGVRVEVVENHHREKAYAAIVQFFDSDHNGILSPEEKKNARIILYGHSWGASETVTLARQLEQEGVPVLLTVQVDSVEKRGENDRVIPANVAEAANFYQLDGFLHGEPLIRAADPSRTHIIGNFRYNYKVTPIRCDQYPWYYRLAMKAHIEIECDPKVWSQVENLIESRLPPRQK